MQILDVADPSRPTLAHLIEPDGQATSVIARDGRLYVAEAEEKVTSPGGRTSGSNRLRVFDIVDHGAEPAELAAPPAAAPGPIVLEGTRLYVRTATGTRIVDVADGRRPVDLGEAPLGSAGFTVSGTQLYSLAGDGLRVVDVASPTAAHETGAYQIVSSDVARIAAADGYVYAQLDSDPTHRPSGLGVFDATDPAQISQVGFVELPSGYINNVLVADGRAYVTTSFNPAGSPELDTTALRIVDLADPTHPVIVGSFKSSVAGFAPGPAVGGGYAYLTRSGPSQGIRVLDVSDPTHVVEIGALREPPWAWQIAVADGHAYLGTNGVLHIFDLGDPLHPRRNRPVEGPAPRACTPSRT